MSDQGLSEQGRASWRRQRALARGGPSSCPPPCRPLSLAPCLPAPCQELDAAQRGVAAARHEREQLAADRARLLAALEERGAHVMVLLASNKRCAQQARGALRGAWAGTKRREGCGLFVSDMLFTTPAPLRHGMHMHMPALGAGSWM